MLLVIVSFLGTSPAHSDREELPSAERVADSANRLMIDTSRGTTHHAWRKLKANSIIPPDRVDAFTAGYQTRMTRTIQSLGQPAGVELVLRNFEVLK